MEFPDVFSLLGMAGGNAGAFLAALLAIVVIDLVLAGDNAVVIAMAARTLPVHLRRKAILWGTLGAIVTRILMTVAVVWLLKIPGLQMIGGIALLWIAYKLLTDSDNDGSHGAGAITMAAALKTIVIADAVMGIDNVLGVAGAAKGSMALVIFGLLISMPIMVWGSTLALKLIERFPATIYAGAAILVYTAMYMITADPLGAALWENRAWLRYAATAAGLALVLGGGWTVSRRRSCE
ncbi:MAG: TerC family protein [Collimonas sp.]|uniref:TerC family protein n=1 Tax=Collimonas sp. TaxID=1963772 RepID=UPI0032630D0E